MFFPCVNDHCGHYLWWLFVFGQAMLYCFNLYCLIALYLLHMHFKLYNDRIVLLFSRYTCPYGSRVSQILELGVSEFCSTVPNSYVKSRVCFRVFFHGIAKRGNCEVEFIQSFFWLYSVPNLLVIQHLETLYLGDNHVKVVCEKVWRKTQECALKKGFVTGSRDWQVAKGGTRVKHAGKLKSHTSCYTTGQNF